MESVNKVSIKPPKLMESNVVAWLYIMEAQFNIAQIKSSSTKFYHVLAALTEDLVGRIPQIVLETNNYEKLKESVVSSYEKSKPELLDKLISSTTMTGRPSIYLNELIAISERLGIGEEIVRHKFIQALPQSIAPVIASQTDLELSRLGKMADDLLRLYNRQDDAHINQVSTPPPSQASKAGHSRSAAVENIPYGLRPFNNNQKPKVCRAHLYFGENAKYCKPWCKWPNKRGLKMQPNSRSSSPARSEDQGNV